ncbi:hypothetical protein CCICO_00815 [Corynebacterium ciconiae DSM 44920]|nr:hypothetical protein CCICO_00815 [Corynebacterium ciconiae DSM 44920]
MASAEPATGHDAAARPPGVVGQLHAASANTGRADPAAAQGRNTGGGAAATSGPPRGARGNRPAAALHSWAGGAGQVCRCHAGAAAAAGVHGEIHDGVRDAAHAGVPGEVRAGVAAHEGGEVRVEKRESPPTGAAEGAASRGGRSDRAECGRLCLSRNRPCLVTLVPKTIRASIHRGTGSREKRRHR